MSSPFFSFVKKEFYHIFRDTRTVMILLIMPIIQIILFGFAITTEVKNVNVAVFDPSKDGVTQQITERLSQSEYFTLTEELQTPDDISHIFKQNKASLVVVFGEDFQNSPYHANKASIQLIADATDPNQAATLTNYASNIINPSSNVSLQLKMLYNPQMKGAYNFVPGVMGLILMLICAMMTSISIVREKETGTMEVLLSSPVKPLYIILAKVTPYFILSVVNLATILLLSVFLLDVPVAGNLALLILLSMLFILVSLSLGLLISNMVNTQIAAMLISGMGLMMPTMILSGLMFPIESMPDVLQRISSIIPARWYIAAVRKLMIQGVDFVYAAKEFTVLACMALTLLAISLKKFNIRLKK